MDNKKLKEGMLALQLEEEAWKELSRDIPWTEDLLERYKDKVDWEAVCNNSDIHWSVAMLEKFRKQIDWTASGDHRGDGRLHQLEGTREPLRSAQCLWSCIL
jgi:hypothetical protein